MPFSSLQLEQIALEGAGFIVDARNFSEVQLSSIVSRALAGNAIVTFTNVGHMTAIQLQKIGSHGPGHVVFDLR